MAFFVLEFLMPSHNDKPDMHSSFSVSRRDFLRYFIGGWGMIMTMPLSLARSAEVGIYPSLLEKYLGEELGYQIGFWLMGHCGDAKTGFLPTDVPDIYRISLEGHGIGFIDFLMGGVKYSYTSFCRYLSDQDRLQPVYFELKKKRGSRMSLRNVSFNHAANKIMFMQTESSGETRMQREPIRTDRIYEDYLTLFYNFRHGYYGPLERNRKYRLPLYTKQQMHSVKLDIADFAEEKQFRSREFNPTDKDFFIRFQINPEDVSSGSGEIQGWLSYDATPVKGTIQDVVFFGDLWGELKEIKGEASNRRVRVPDVVKNLLNGMWE